MLISLLLLQISKTCIEKVKEREAGMVLITTNDCNNCQKMSNLVSKMKKLIPKEGKICSQDGRHFEKILQRKPNFDVANFALYRKGEFLSIITDNLTEDTISQTMKTLLNPPIYKVDENTINRSIFYQKNKTVVFRNNEEDNEFYKVAILFRDYPITFLLAEGEFGATMIDNVKKRTIHYRGYPESLVEWVAKTADITPPLPYFSPNNTLLVYATYGSVPKETDNIFDSLSYQLVGHVSLGYANWDRDKYLLRNCKISPNNGTYLGINPNGVCYPFVDDDVVTPELLNFFIRNVRIGYYDYPSPSSQPIYSFGRVVPLNATSILYKIPSHKCTVLHYSNSKSLSHDEVSRAYARVARKFSQPNLTFYELDAYYNWAPPYVPKNDGFPLIAMWGPHDWRPYIFREILSNGTLANWVLAKANSVCNITIM